MVAIAEAAVMLTPSLLPGLTPCRWKDESIATLLRATDASSSKRTPDKLMSLLANEIRIVLYYRSLLTKEEIIEIAFILRLICGFHDVKEREVTFSFHRRFAFDYLFPFG
jgi:hypothetical protein